MKLKITFIFLFFILGIKAQDSLKIDTTFDIHKSKLISELKALNNTFTEEISQKYKRKIYKKIKDELALTNDDFNEILNDKDFIFDKRITNITDRILNELKQVNPQIPKNTIILVSKNPSLNAYCMPNGVFVLNMGIFYFLKNEDQVASVVAHEISHKLLNHSVKFVEKKIEEDLVSKQNKEVKKLKHSKYNKSKKAFELYKNRLYATGGFRRSNEFEADSLGFILLKNTQYNTNEMLTSFKIIEKLDSIKHKELKKETLVQYFKTPILKFNNEWIKQEESIFNYSLKKNKLDKDKIATHPSAKDRIEKLLKLFPTKPQKKDIELREDFKKVLEISKHNYISSLIFYEKYDLALYYTLVGLQNKKNTETITKYKKDLANILNLIYKARKEYNLNRYFEQVNAGKHDEGYSQMLTLIWNLSLEDIKSIADYYSM